MKRQLFFILILVLLIFGSSFAGNKITITVSAHVLPKLSQRILYQQREIQISEVDIQKGYIEVFSGTILQISTNDRGGYGLFFEGGSQFFKEIWVIEKGKITILPSDGGFVHQPYSGGKVEVKEISYRLFLKENIQPGLFPFPLRVRASLI